MTGSISYTLPDGVEFIRIGPVKDFGKEFVLCPNGLLSEGAGVLVRIKDGYSRVYDIMRDSWVITKNLPHPQDVTFRYRARTQFDLDGLRGAALRQKEYPPLVEVTGLD